jgi:hypothetical protein
MRVERTDHLQFYECYLTIDEYEQLRRTTDSYHAELIMHRTEYVSGSGLR